VLFVCLHGAAKSVVAAEHLRRLAAERGIRLETSAAGVEPDDEIPPAVAAALAEEGFDVRDRRPEGVTAEGIGAADRVVSFGCDLSNVAPTGVPVTTWADMPAVSDGYDVARDAIVARLVPLLDEIADETAPATGDRGSP
jgi:protein-tyrosine-phosphatase